MHCRRELEKLAQRRLGKEQLCLEGVGCNSLWDMNAFDSMGQRTAGETGGGEEGTERSSRDLSRWHPEGAPEVLMEILLEKSENGEVSL